ncbi:MAG: DUF402 domain-containing protein [Bacteroidota bacterium]
MWRKGDAVLLRGVYGQHPTYVQSVRVVKDSPGETALAIWPGAECVASAGYLHRRRSEDSPWDRWGETLSQTLQPEKFIWHSNRFLILLEPGKYFSTILMWEAASQQFLCYYVNFQLPFRRTRLGFDTLDLDLDLVISPDFEWHWKDLDEYERGIQSGGIRPEWASCVEEAQQEATARLAGRRYPLDGSWLSWKLPDWTPPRLPADWQASV